MCINSKIVHGVFMIDKNIYSSSWRLLGYYLEAPRKSISAGKIKTGDNIDI